MKNKYTVVASKICIYTESTFKIHKSLCLRLHNRSKTLMPTSFAAKSTKTVQAVRSLPIWFEGVGIDAKESKESLVA